MGGRALFVPWEEPDFVGVLLEGEDLQQFGDVQADHG